MASGVIDPKKEWLLTRLRYRLRIRKIQDVSQSQREASSQSEEKLKAYGQQWCDRISDTFKIADISSCRRGLAKALELAIEQTCSIRRCHQGRPCHRCTLTEAKREDNDKDRDTCKSKYDFVPQENRIVRFNRTPTLNRTQVDAHTLHLLASRNNLTM